MLSGLGVLDAKQDSATTSFRYPSRPSNSAKMKLHYIGILRNDSKPAVELCSEMELSAYSRFTRNSYAEFMSLFSKKVAESTRPGQRQDIEEGDNTFHCVGRSEGICGVIISDHQYPSLVAHQLLSKMSQGHANNGRNSVDEFLTKHPRSTWATGEPELVLPELKEYLTRYQDPQQADSILKIQKELDETKIVLHKTIQSVLERGEKIDDLVAKSDGLSSQSKMFYQQAKKQNSCCIVM
ncbi:synaptobrevin [Colletotrichum cuscutae]|uniref:Synaptobrevin homolog YKT6 n=1 Tax=Colletotrichum cuscutae TaxID=1209917 RepID=A0AAI9V653_9PEZI|nr:synaptobrevin [Colletotrichum cuscutae]